MTDWDQTSIVFDHRAFRAAWAQAPPIPDLGPIFTPVIIASAQQCQAVINIDAAARRARGAVPDAPPWCAHHGSPYFPYEWEPARVPCAGRRRP